MERNVRHIKIIVSLILIVVIINSVGVALFGGSIKGEVASTVKSMILDNTSSEFQIRSVTKPEFDKIKTDIDSLKITKADKKDIIKLDSLLTPMASQINDLWIKNINK